MRHLSETKKFGLKRGPRKSFMKILAQNLIMKERIKTTEARAKAIRPVVERLVSHGKKQNVAALRTLIEKLPKQAAYKMYHEIAPRYKDRKGGYTRIVKHLVPRKHDAAKMATIEFV